MKTYFLQLDNHVHLRSFAGILSDKLINYDMDTLRVYGIRCSTYIFSRITLLRK